MHISDFISEIEIIVSADCSKILARKNFIFMAIVIVIITIHLDYFIVDFLWFSPVVMWKDRIGIISNPAKIITTLLLHSDCGVNCSREMCCVILNVVITWTLKASTACAWTRYIGFTRWKRWTRMTIITLVFPANSRRRFILDHANTLDRQFLSDFKLLLVQIFLRVLYFLVDALATLLDSLKFSDEIFDSIRCSIIRTETRIAFVVPTTIDTACIQLQYWRY